MTKLTNILKVVRDVVREEDGASLIEYTALIAILLVAVIVTITAVGGWISLNWGKLNAALP